MEITLRESSVKGDIKMARKQERTVVSLEVSLEWASGIRQARVSDLSLGGCFIDSIVNIRQGERMQLKIKVSDGEWLELTGEVRYVFAGCGFGISFLSLSDKDKIIIEHLILMHNGNPWGTD
jgi:hypothetical protein